MINKLDKYLPLISLILAVISIVNCIKELTIIVLTMGILIFGYAIFKFTKKEGNIQIAVLSIVTIINSILWIIFQYGVYEKLISTM